MKEYQNVLSSTELEKIDKYFRAANYLSVGQLYLRDNPLLRSPLKFSDIKKNIVGHWGTVPGQTFIYTHLNRIIKKYDLNMIYLSGPGHGGNSVVSEVYLEGTYSEIYPNITEDIEGMKKLFKQFSFPGGISSHVAPETPGSIHEGGELGYSLAHAFGAVLDNPDLIATCVVGDGEAETGPLATSWHYNKFLNPKTDCAIIPILHLNGYTHQDPGFLSHLATKKADIVRIYLPPDANCLLSCFDHCIKTKNYINVIVASKHPRPQWLTMDQAIKHCTQGIGIWEWASNDKNSETDIVMACCGDTPTLETLAAVSILRSNFPEVKVRVVNVVDLMRLQSNLEHPHGLTDDDYDLLFTKDKPIIFAFHGYPSLIHQLTYKRTNKELHVHGYKEEGTITTPFDMRVQNEIDRYHLVMDALKYLPKLKNRSAILNQWCKDKLVEHKEYIHEYGDDMPDVKNWNWKTATDNKDLI